MSLQTVLRTIFCAYLIFNAYETIYDSKAHAKEFDRHFASFEKSIAKVVKPPYLLSSKFMTKHSWKLVVLLAFAQLVLATVGLFNDKFVPFAGLTFLFRALGRSEVLSLLCCGRPLADYLPALAALSIFIASIHFCSCEKGKPEVSDERKNK